MQCKSGSMPRFKVSNAVFVSFGMVAACARTEATSSRATVLAGTPRPDSTATTTHTVDNAGFVDNGGRTSDMTARTELSGMRATEAGGERPTATTGGIPLPLGPRAPGRADRGEGAGSGGATSPAGGPSSEATSRIAEARCDRETACNRIGSGRAWASKAACREAQRERVGRLIEPAVCKRGVDSVQLTSCLTEVRSQACDDPRDTIDATAHCRASALCAL